MTTQPKSILLLVSGIILLLWGVFQAFSALLFLLLEVSSTFPFIVAFFIISSVNLIAGIHAVKYYKRPERVGRCFLWGAIALLGNIVAAFILQERIPLEAVAIITLYFIGVCRLKISTAEPKQ